SYSAFMNGLVKANIGLNRKSLSELAISHPAIFDEIFAAAKAAAGRTNA
ncbi:MAG: 50S ribosomal protein L20, partial [Phycisphaerae bacterium]